MNKRIFRRTLLLSLALCATAGAQDAEEARARRPRLGLDPGSPQNQNANPSIPFMVESSRKDLWVLDFHGFIQTIGSIGVRLRDDPAPGQNKVLLGMPPAIPQDPRKFQWTGVIPQPWAQLAVSYGSSLVRGTMILGGRNVVNQSAFLYPPTQLALTDAFLSFNLTEPLGQVVTINLGAFKNRYGIMGEYDSGRYGTPVIARTNTMGETIDAVFEFSDVSLMLEQGFGGGLGIPAGVGPEAWNDFADPNVRSTVVTHLHGAVGFGEFAQLGLHYLHAASQDDRLSAAQALPEGSISVLGAEVRATAGRFGHLYLGGADVTATDSATVSPAIEILNCRGGGELMKNYLGANSNNGTGRLLTVAGQYDLSVAHLLYPDVVDAGPDVLVSLFGMSTKVNSDDAAQDGAQKTKFGGELTYAALPWFAAGARFDHVIQDADFPERTFEILSPRVIFHTDWVGTDQVVFQYSHFFYGYGVVAEGGLPPIDNPVIPKDTDVFTLSASIGW